MPKDKTGKATPQTDDFGYQNYLISFFENSENMSRATGRTTRILSSLKKGDILIVHSQNCVKWMKDRLVDLKNLKGKRAIEKLDGIRIVYVNPRSFTVPEFLYREEGNVVYDHHWMYQHIQWRLEKILEFPMELRRLVKPKGADHAKCQTYSYSGQIWPENTGKVQH